MNDDTLTRIADALERLAPAPAPAPSFAEAGAYIWSTDPDRLEPVAMSTGSTCRSWSASTAPATRC